MSSTVAPRRSARIAKKAADNKPAPPQKPLTLAQMFPELKTFVAEPVSKPSLNTRDDSKGCNNDTSSSVSKLASKLASIKNLYIHDAFFKPPSTSGPYSLLSFSDGPYRSLCLRVHSNKFVLCIEYVDSDDEREYDVVEMQEQFEPLITFSYQQLLERCATPLSHYTCYEDAKFLNRFFKAISYALPFMMKHVEQEQEPELTQKYAQSYMDEARRLAALNAPK